MAGVGQQRIRKIQLLPEARVRADVIRADTEYCRILAPEPGESVSEGRRFDASPRGVVLGIEEEDDVPAAQILQRDLRALIGLEDEVGGRLAGFDIHEMGVSSSRVSRAIRRP